MGTLGNKATSNPLKSGMKINVELQGVDIFSDLLEIIGGILADERIDRAIRVEYSNEIRKLTETEAGKNDD